MLSLNSTVPNPVRPFGRILQIEPVLDMVEAWARSGGITSPDNRPDGIPRFRGVGFPSPKKIVYGNLSAEGQPKPIAVLRAILEASDQLGTESFEEREIQRKAAVEGKLHTHLSKVRGLLKAVNYPETVQQHTDGEVMTYIYLAPDPPKRIE
ncbi:hypothetical protein [Limnoglobus roseus]|nr:hypothetical protein [Limnoglobus roseus]